MISRKRYKGVTCVVLIFSFCHQGADRAVPVLIIGILVFLPGFYHLRIAYYASKGYRGYSYDDIPDFDDQQSPWLLKRQGTHLVGQELWLRAEEVYSLQMFCKTMAGLYESFSKMFVLCNQLIRTRCFHLLALAQLDKFLHLRVHHVRTVRLIVWEGRLFRSEKCCPRGEPPFCPRRQFLQHMENVLCIVSYY